MKIHDLKIAPEYLTKIFQGNKNWELRKNDRDFKEGDWICVRGYESGKYLSELKFGIIKFILEDYKGLEDGYCILSVKWVPSFISWILEIIVKLQSRD